ncbi:MAG: aminotransferase class I/II-fold pyridoxal phosphate-dependent enzyme [Bacteroidales bacterium]|nr:aminotransferase class I/II-fold pyridoxal phosphate-dependent enzyme [Bacteroidales bacterium]
MKKRIYLSSPHMSGGEMKYINEAFKQNWIAPLGPNVNAFEKTLAGYCGVEHAAALSSGSAAIHLALVMLGVCQGDEVIASSFTFSATVNPIKYLGATPVLIDSEPETWNMDPCLLELALKERRAKGVEHRVKAIIVVHLYGMPAKMDEIIEIADRYEIPVIEDAAEALGSRYENKHVGSIGIMAVLSFNGNKIITTSGGGALISNDKELIEKARFLSTQARDKAPYYQHSQVGYNYRMSNVLAGIGRGQMEAINMRVQQRRDNYEFYFQNLKGIPGISFLEEPSDKFYSNRWLTTILIDPSEAGISCWDLQDECKKENIETRPLWKPMHMQPVFSSCPSYVNGVSSELFNQGLCLPSGSNMTDEDRGRILEVISIKLKR